MLQENLLSAFQMQPSVFTPVAPSMPSSTALLQLQQLQQLQPYLTLALLAANREREKLGETAPSSDIVKPVPILPFTTQMDQSSPPTLTKQSQHALASRNKLGRSYNPGRPLAMEDRKKILELYEQGFKISHIARQIGVTHSCVSKIMSRFRRTGSMHPRSFANTQQTSSQQSPPPVPPQSPPHDIASAIMAWQHTNNMQEISRRREEESDSEHVSMDEDKSDISKCGSPVSRLSISPSSAFSPPTRKRSPSYSIDSLLNQ